MEGPNEDLWTSRCGRKEGGRSEAESRRGAAAFRFYTETLAREQCRSFEAPGVQLHSLSWVIRRRQEISPWPNSEIVRRGLLALSNEQGVGSGVFRSL